MVFNEWILAIGKKNPDFIFKNIHRKYILRLSDQDNAVGKRQTQDVLSASNEEKQEKCFAEWSEMMNKYEEIFICM